MPRRPPTRSCTRPIWCVFIGCDTGDQVTHTWRIPSIDTPCVQIDIDPAELGRSYPQHARPDGRSESHARQLLIDALGNPARDTAFADRAAGIVAAWREGRAPRWRAMRRRFGPIGCAPRSPVRCRQDGILVADTGYSGIWSSTLIELNGEGQTYLRAAGSLGWSFPAALGAKCAAGKRKVDLLVRRRRDLLPPHRTGDRSAARHRRRVGGQQQLGLRPGLAEHPASARQHGQATCAS